MVGFTDFIGPAFDLAGGLFQNSSNKSTAASNTAQSAANQEKALNALTGSTPDSVTTRNAQGGFDVDYAPGSDQSILNTGDIDRANTVNAATSGYQPTFGGLQDAIAFNQRDINNNREMFTDQLDTFQAGELRKNRDANPLQTALSQKAIGSSINQFNENANKNSLGLFNAQNTADQALLQQIIANNSPRAATLNGPGGAAAQVTAQTPPPSIPNSANFGSLLASTGSNYMSQLAQQQATEDANAASDKRLRLLAELGAF
jgi:hypothetical protein